MHPSTVGFLRVLRGVGCRHVALIASLALAGAALANDEATPSAAPAPSSGATAMPDFSPGFPGLNMKEGRQLFLSFCATCHGVYAEGGIGPNLADDYWIHGARPSQILVSVAFGYAEKGMPSWIKPLGVERLRRIVAYLTWLRHVPVPLPPGVKGKPGEGEWVQREVRRPAAVDTPSAPYLPATCCLVFTTTSRPPAPKEPAADPSRR